MSDTHGMDEPLEAEGVQPDRDVSEELVSRLHVIEEQPLAERAAAFALLHDELRTRLEGGDGVEPRG